MTLSCLIRPGKSTVTLEFSRALPTFPSLYPRAISRHFRWVVAPGWDLKYVADVMAHVNRGTFPVEMVTSRLRFYELVADLVCYEGVEGIAEATRYTLTLAVGRFFDKAEVATAAARTIQRHLYPDDQLELSMEEAAADTDAPSAYTFRFDACGQESPEPPSQRN